MKRFQCNGCGECCRKIRGRLGKEEEEFLKEHAYGKMPVIQLAPIEKLSFPLWPDEAKKLKQKAEELRVNAEIRLLRAMLDLNTNTVYILTYFLDHNSCPFLGDKNECLIYDERPLVCRQFPMQSSKEYAVCQGINEPDAAELEKTKDQQHLQHYFAESFDAAIENDKKIEQQNKKIFELVKSKQIRPAMNYPYDLLLKRIDKCIKKDFGESF